MISPSSRTLLVDAIRPPAGFTLSSAVALTYTLDLTTLLTVPLHLALMGTGRRDELLKDPLALLEALRRVTSKLAIVCQHGRIAAPSVPHVLYGLLEGCVVEVNAPGGGVFHPKAWLLRYEAASDGEVLMRLIVLSRNLTPDRCWDVSLVIEGEPKGSVVALSRPLSQLLHAVPGMAAARVPDAVGRVLSGLADEVLRTRWSDLPAGFEEVAFDVVGLQRRPWTPPEAERLAVVSPFVTAPALQMLAESTGEAKVLISRQEELEKLTADAVKCFERQFVLHEQAETESGEDTSDGACLRGLHAKIYVAERGWYTTVCVGSANATSASLLSGSNVELLCALTGKTSRVGGIDDLLGDKGLSDYLTPFAAPPEPVLPSIQDEAEDALNHARQAIASLGISVTTSAAENGQVQLIYSAERATAVEGVARIRFWPVSLPPEHATDAQELLAGKPVTVGPIALASLTGFTAFELRSSVCDLTICFVLNVPISCSTKERDAAVLRTIIANREGFLRYLLLLLRDDIQNADMAQLAAALGGSDARWQKGFDEMPLLEELTRALTRDPERLRAIGRVVEQLLASPDADQVVSKEFLEVWRAYESVLAEVKP